MDPETFDIILTILLALLFPLIGFVYKSLNKKSKARTNMMNNILYNQNNIKDNDEDIKEMKVDIKDIKNHLMEKK